MTEKQKRIIHWSIRAAVSISLIAWLIFHVTLDKLDFEIAQMQFSFLLLAVAIKGVGVSSGILRWRLLLRGQELHLPLNNLGGAYLVGLFFGSFTPSTIGLDVYRTYYAAVRTRAVAKCVAVTLVEKLAGLLALSILALAVLPFGARFMQTQVLWVLAACVCAPILATGLILAFPGALHRVAERLTRRRNRFTLGLAKMSLAVARFGAQRSRLGLALLLGFVVHGATVVSYLATARAVGVNVPASEILFIGPLMIAGTLVPVSIAGIGVREGFFAFFLTRIGVSTEQAVLLGTLGFLTGEVYALLGGAVWALQPASRPEEGHGLVEVVKRAAVFIRGRESKEELSS